jgi:hypothetical protein
MELSKREYRELGIIQKRLANNSATSNDVKTFLNLMNKSGNEMEMSSYIENVGFSSIGDFKEELNNKASNENLIKGLAVVGGAVLVAWLLTKK